MKKLVGALLGLLTIGAVGIGTTGTVYAQGYNWSGFYFGGHVGGAWANADWTHQNVGLTLERFNHDISSVVGGGQLGLQGQWGAWVAGVELSLSGGPDLDDTLVATTIANRTRTASIGSIFLATARLGYAMDRSLIYIKGGYANARVDLSSHVLSTGQLTSFSSERDDGWTIGAGWEYAWLSGVIAGLQYDFVSLDGSNRLNVGQPGFVVQNHLNVDADIHMVTARISFLLGRAAPVAKPLK